MGPKRVFTCGTRCVLHATSGPDHGAFLVCGATTGRAIHAYHYDERPAYTAEFLLSEGLPRDHELGKMIRGRKKDSARDAATTKAVDTSAVIGHGDR